MLTHEIGHALELHHSPQKNSIMYVFVPSKTFPVRLNEADFLAIQNLYSLKNKSEVSRSVPATTTVATTMIATRNREGSTNVDLRVARCGVGVRRQNVAYQRYLWSVSVNGKSYCRSLFLMDYLYFLPDNFTRLAGAY
ncbi:hypothetical protein P5V15_007169 [Pogonomyrmex californicus]